MIRKSRIIFALIIIVLAVPVWLGVSRLLIRQEPDGGLGGALPALMDRVGKIGADENAEKEYRTLLVELDREFQKMLERHCVTKELATDEEQIWFCKAGQRGVAIIQTKRDISIFRDKTYVQVFIKALGDVNLGSSSPRRFTEYGLDSSFGVEGKVVRQQGSAVIVLDNVPKDPDTIVFGSQEFGFGPKFSELVPADKELQKTLVKLMPPWRKFK